MARRFLIGAVTLHLAALALASGDARANDEPRDAKASKPEPDDDDSSDDKPKPPPAPPKVTWLGYVEALYQYNFNRPSNGITNYRAFDNRANTFTLSNVAAGAAWEVGPVSGKLVLQVGHTPSSYYANEPALSGSSTANASSSELWKYVQEANVGYKAPIGDGLLLQMGLFLSPIGPETIPIKDNWNWSRSTLFFALPYYHTGIRATYPLTDEISASVGVYNGWNSVVDGNEDKSVSASVAYKIVDKLNAQLLYFGGNERKSGAPEGPYWRHDFDAYAQVDVCKCFSFMVHGNAGFEPNRFGTSSWYGGALYARARLFDWLFLAVRGDRFWEQAPADASTIFWPPGTTWVSSGTATLDARPRDNVSIRLEYRHDQADRDLYFRSNVAQAITAGNPYVPNAHTQDTLTLGATTWF